MAQQTLLRELSHGEQAFYHGSVFIGTLSHIEGELPSHVLQKSLDLIIEKNTILQCKVIESDKRYYFSPIDQPTIQVNERTLDNEGQALQHYESLINTQDRAEHGLIEVHLLKLNNAKHCYLLTKVSHIISDGMCNTRLHNDLLSFSDKIMQGLTPALSQCNATPAPTRALPEAIENYLLPRFDGLSVEEVAEEKKHEILRVQHRVLTETNKAKSSQIANTHSKVRVKPYTLSQAQTKQVLAWCKQNGVSVNNALIAALLLSANKLLPEKNNHFLVRQAVNLRQKVHPNINDAEFITAAGSMMPSLSVKESDTLESLSQLVTIASHGAMEFTSTLQNHKANKELLGSVNVPLAFHISNLGRLSVESCFAHLNLKHLVMLPSINFGATVPLVISTIDERLNITSHADNFLYSIQFIDRLIWKAIELVCPIKKQEVQFTS